MSVVCILYKYIFIHINDANGYREPSVLDECDITEDVKEVLLEDIRKRLTPQAVKIRAGK